MNLMACITKELHGSCNHFQCPHSTETTHGYECIDLYSYKGYSFCEVGEGCLPQCPHSWQQGTAKDRASKEFLKKWQEEMDQQQEEFLRENGQLVQPTK
jgi:hypothetical protein